MLIYVCVYGGAGVSGCSAWSRDSSAGKQAVMSVSGQGSNHDGGGGGAASLRLGRAPATVLVWRDEVHNECRRRRAIGRSGGGVVAGRTSGRTTVGECKQRNRCGDSVMRLSIASSEMLSCWTSRDSISARKFCLPSW
eukprot:GHVU01219828.1.p2 GENE.GHVU01219828.1~~GHVU01219828.1.p2  ORF type:complete len:138 (-),score=0.57 GHVU01219828.1:14-427(-)